MGATVRIDFELIAQLQKNDADARHRFWSAYFRPVLAICTRVLGPGAIAVDVTTDLLNDFMFRYVHNVQSPSAAWSYLKLMAIRRSVREKKRGMKNEPVENIAINLDNTDFSQADIQVMLSKLESCLALLTPKAQSAIRMKYTQGVSNEQIGNTVGGTKQYIGRLLRKSLEMLRDCMGRKEVSHG
ncbi:MAG: sigma-70 family RNA polymerase sigma factor [Deltaproteobacteria bacterium]|nr:sigma-70 family RNA polymerase sigma factor [Deltaproteobacteria bacterium]MBN2674009.1 sigma-70 family RNA polymerase sigma factor [Deltaproteobacteria bacterium]